MIELERRLRNNGNSDQFLEKVFLVLKNQNEPQLTTLIGEGECNLIFVFLHMYM